MSNDIDDFAYDELAGFQVLDLGRRETKRSAIIYDLASMMAIKVQKMPKGEKKNG